MSIILIASLPVLAQQLFVKNFFQEKKTINKAGYILGADQDAVKWKDTMYYNASKLRSCRYATIPVTLTNITADTLKYIDMSCSTLDIFTTDLTDSRIFQDLKDCFKNNPTVFKLAPYGSATFSVPVYVFSNDLDSGNVLTPKEFKIGMGILKYIGKTSIASDFQNIDSMMRNKENLMWSNSVIVK